MREIDEIHQSERNAEADAEHEEQHAVGGAVEERWSARKNSVVSQNALRIETLASIAVEASDLDLMPSQTADRFSRHGRPLARPFDTIGALWILGDDAQFTACASDP